MENMYIHAEVVAEDAMDMTETAVAVTENMRADATVTVTADADVINILMTDEDGGCHIELEHRGFPEEIPPRPHTFYRQGRGS